MRGDRQSRIEQIVEAARELFCERGYEQVAMAEIAARLGVVEGTLYKYFESKHALLIRVVQTWYSGLLEGFRTELPGITGTRQRVRYLVWRHLRTMQDDAAMAALMFDQVRNRDDYRDSPLQQINREYTETLTDLIREGMARGEFRRDIPLELVRDLVFGTIEHQSWRYRGGGVRIDRRQRAQIERTADQIVEILFRGLAPAGADSADPAGLDLRALRAQTERLANLADRFEALPTARSLSARAGNRRHSL